MAAAPGHAAVEAVVFDLDGVLVDSEPLWARAREQLVRERGGRWRPGATRAMMGMSSPEWSRYMHEQLAVPMAPEAISAEVVAMLERSYGHELPLLPGAAEAVVSLADHWPLGLASSANRTVIELVLARSGLAPLFEASVSSEEVAHGKPAPDVYVEAARRLQRAPGRCAAVEDSTNGLRAAAAAGLRVIAVPNASFPPAPAALALADAVIGSLASLGPGLVRGLV
jgi:HAD superfamily hydrolase (TIGR01509 family)